MINEISGIEEVSLTTNGTSLARLALPLELAGLRRVNISVDTFRADRYSRITRTGSFENVLAGMIAARSAGLLPLRLNVVLIPGLNDDEVLDFAASTLDEDWDVRFIERMPFLEGQCGESSLLEGYVSGDDVRRRIESRFGRLEECENGVGEGPARYLRVPGAAGRIGFISPITEEGFCARCNRMRLTATGKLRPCLLTDQEVDLRTALRDGAQGAEIRHLITRALQTKPDSHHLHDGNRPRKRNMTQIGG
jgi:cyclic pyranopterin phosphate synthase